MLLAGGISEQRAREWMIVQGLTEDDLEWDPGRLDRYRARQGTGDST